MVLRSDGENAIRDLLGKIAAMRSSETVLEQSPKGDSKANGRAERAVQSVEKQTRVYRNQLVFGSEWKAQLSHDFLFLTYFKYNRLIR